MAKIDFSFLFGQVVRNISLEEGVAKQMTDAPRRLRDGGWMIDKVELLFENGVVTKVDTVIGRDPGGPIRATTISTCAVALLAAKPFPGGGSGPLWIEREVLVSEDSVPQSFSDQTWRSAA